jgi:hypothetical protein
MSWENVLITAIAVGGTLAASWIQLRYSRRARENDRREARIREGAAALAPFATLLTHLNPERLLANVRPESLSQLEEAYAEYERFRNPLQAFALAQTSRPIREAAWSLDLAVEWVLQSSAVPVKMRLANRDHSEAEAAAMTRYADARRAANELHELMHRREGSRALTFLPNRRQPQLDE